MPLKSWKKLSEKVVYKNPFWTYKLDKFIIGDHQEGEYHYVHTPGSSMVIPITSSKKIILVNQYRYLNQKESLEFPCGAVFDGMLPIENAQKELREETGYLAKTLNYIGNFNPFTGACDEMCNVYIGLDLEYSPLPKDATEEFEVLELTASELESKILSNFIWDGMTIAAWYLSKNKIETILV